VEREGQPSAVKMSTLIRFREKIGEKKKKSSTDGKEVNLFLFKGHQTSQSKNKFPEIFKSKITAFCTNKQIEIKIG
jgi:hypothetical protein